jgi:hypothetical protein
MMGLRGAALNQLLERYGANAMDLNNPSFPGSHNQNVAPGFSEFWKPDEWNATVGVNYPAGEERQAARQAARQQARDAWVAAGRPGGPMADPMNEGMDPSAFGGTTGGGQDYLSILLNPDLGMEDVNFQDQQARYEQAYMDRARGLLDPIFSDKRATLDEQLANRGMPTGSEETELLNKRLNEQETDTYTKTALDAILAGGSETRSNRAQTLAERLGQFGATSQARNQLFGEDTMNFNQLASILGLSQTPTSSYYGPGMVDTTGAYNTQLAYQNSNRSFIGDLLGGLLGLGGQLGGAALMPGA